VSGSQAQSKETRLGFFGTIVRFIRQVVSELKKVVYPTRQELVTFATVVLVFVVIFMAFVALVDFGAGKLVTLVFT
jgi:preprotein translocase subunit SecE